MSMIFKQATIMALAGVGLCLFFIVGSWNCLGRNILLELPDGAPTHATKLIPGPLAKSIFVRPDGTLIRQTLDDRQVVEDAQIQVGPLRDVAYAAERIATLDEGGGIAIYAVPSLRIIARGSAPRPRDEYTPPFDVALSKDGLMIAAGDGDDKVHRWNVQTGQELGVEQFSSRIERVAFDEKGTLFASGSGSELLVWPVQGPVNRSSASGTGSKAGVAGAYWVDQDGEAIGPGWRIDLDYPGGRAFVSHDGRLIALAMGSNWIAGSMSHTAVVDAATGKNVVWIRHPAWRRDTVAWWGDRLILGGTNGYLGVFDTKTGNREWSLTGHSAEIVSADVHGNRLVTLDSAGSVREFDLATLK